MKVLIDECTPHALQKFLSANGHECKSVQECGWRGKKNGELLTAAEGTFEVLVTIDANLRYQQNLAGRKIAIVILTARANRLKDLEPHFVACLDAVQRIKPGQLIHVGPEDEPRP